MTNEDDYVRFIISRLLSGMFGSVPSAIGGGIILDVFFLHDRGKAFICYEVSILLGASVGPTFSGFISDSQVVDDLFLVDCAVIGHFSHRRFLGGRRNGLRPAVRYYACESA